MQEEEKEEEKDGKEEEKEEQKVVKEEKEGVALGQPKYPPKEEVQEVFNLKPNQ